MIRNLVVMTAGLALCAALARADDPAPAKVTLDPVSLSVNKKLDDKDLPWFASTSMTFRLKHAGKEILGIDTATSKIDSLKDDKDNSLIGTGFFKPNFYTGSISKDKSALFISLSTSSNPGKGASKVTLKGTVALRCGLDAKTTEAKEVEFKLPKKDDPDLKIGDHVFKVTSERGFGFDAGATFTISTDKPGIKSITVKDEDGKDVEAMPGYGSYQDFRTKMWVYSYTLRKQVKKGKVSITYYNKEEKVNVPVTLTIGLGL